MRRSLHISNLLLLAVLLSSTSSAQPMYEINSRGQIGESGSIGLAVSRNGQFGAGFSTNSNPDSEITFLWSSGASVTPLPSATDRPFSTPQSVNDIGTIAGIGAMNSMGGFATPVIWKNGSAIVLGLPTGAPFGRAYGINNSELIVGSATFASSDRAVMFTESAAAVLLTQTLPGGEILRIAYSVNDTGRIVGEAFNPSNSAVTRAFHLDPGDGQATDIGVLPGLGHTSATAFDVSSNGQITGRSSMNGQVDRRPYVWNEVDGMTEIPLPLGATAGGGRGVNADGWVVGAAAGGGSALPFLYDGNQTYLVQDLIAGGGVGWELIGAASIADNGTIIGTGRLNGQTIAFAMLRIIIGDLNGDGAINLLDVAPFVDALLIGNFAAAADVNQDGVVNLLDVAPFIELLVN